MQKSEMISENDLKAKTKKRRQSDSNQRPLGYEPNELTPAPPRVIFFLSVYFTTTACIPI